jgi:transcriptional regulator with XRE-family HTH domain
MGVTMVTSLSGTDRKPEATTRNHSFEQRPLALLGHAPPAQPMALLPPGLIACSSFSAVLSFAAQGSGMDDQDLAQRLNICKGYMSRFLRGVAEAWARRVVRFMEATHSLAPLQWLAAQVGCEVVQLDTRAAEVAALQARLAELTRAA